MYIYNEKTQLNENNNNYENDNNKKNDRWNLGEYIGQWKWLCRKSENGEQEDGTKRLTDR